MMKMRTFIGGFDIKTGDLMIPSIFFILLTFAFFLACDDVSKRNVMAAELGEGINAVSSLCCPHTILSSSSSLLLPSVITVTSSSSSPCPSSAFLIFFFLRPVLPFSSAFPSSFPPLVNQTWTSALDYSHFGYYVDSLHVVIFIVNTTTMFL